MKVEVQCEGELHEVEIHTDRSVSIDPHKHDPELEAGLVALGAKPPLCVLLLSDDEQAKKDVCNMGDVNGATMFAIAMTMSDENRCGIATRQTSYQMAPTFRFLLAMTCDDDTKKRVATETLGLSSDQRFELAMSGESDDLLYHVAAYGEGLTPQQRWELTSAIHDVDLRQEAARIAPDLTDTERRELIDDPRAYEEESWRSFGYEDDETPELDFDY